MNRIEYDLDGRREELKVPKSFSEMTGEQLVATIRMMNGEDVDKQLQLICGLPDDVFALLSEFQRFVLLDSITEVLNVDVNTISFKSWKITAIDINGEKWFGPMSNFGNIEWGEFVYADQCMIQGFHRAVIAALFRPQRTDYDGESDRRIPFTTYGTTKRFEQLSELDKDVQTAILLNYRAMRSASLAAVYTEIFPYHDVIADDGPNDNPPEPEEQPQQFSWSNIHHDLLGDNIQDEERFLHLPVHTVLYRLNEKIKDNRRRKNGKLYD